MTLLRNILYQVFTMLYFLAGFGQKVHLEKVGILPDDIEECSGIALLPSGHIGMINDSGNRPDLYITDHEGNIISKRCLIEVANHDWEELTYDDGWLFIGDFGNNRNKREDLVIYRYSMDKNDSATYYGAIHFTYADQQDFPPDYKFRNYDLEAMVHRDDSLYIFTKNRTRPFTGYTYLYGMPDKPGHYTLTRLDSFRTGFGQEQFFWIAGAALHQPSGSLALLGYDKMWLFTNYPGSHFFRGESQTISFEFLSQKEAITYVSPNEVLITDERNRFGGGNVYHGLLPKNKGVEYVELQDTAAIRLLSRQFSVSIVVELPSSIQGKVLWEIYKTNGTRVLAGHENISVENHQLIINTADFEPGGYVLNVITDDGPHAFKLKKLYSIKRNN